MDIPESRNYPVSSLTPLYTEREKNSNYFSLETVVRKKGQIV